jgi:hypothetical protein
MQTDAGDPRHAEVMPLPSLVHPLVQQGLAPDSQQMCICLVFCTRRALRIESQWSSSLVTSLRLTLHRDCL